MLIRYLFIYGKSNGWVDSLNQYIVNKIKDVSSFIDINDLKIKADIPFYYVKHALASLAVIGNII